jgi:hypothetical protein
LLDRIYELANKGTHTIVSEKEDDIEKGILERIDRKNNEKIVKKVGEKEDEELIRIFEENIQKDNKIGLENYKENFDKLHLYGRVKKFFKETGISSEPCRDKSGNRMYKFYDSKKIFVIKEG